MFLSGHHNVSLFSTKGHEYTVTRRRNRALKLGNSYCLHDIDQPMENYTYLFNFFSLSLKEVKYTSDSSNLGIMAINTIIIIVKVYFGVNCLLMHIISKTHRTLIIDLLSS